MAKLKPLDVPTAAQWLRVSEQEVRRRDATYDPATDTVQVSARMAEMAEFAKAKAAFGRAFVSTFAPALDRINSLLSRLTRV